mmetsp:Transcript_90514/g.251620  ORF Transcript_90514/g.251620 Transcript_90514/m.251620 type:complete len:302 (+) Transcript_90514:3770-4675(+)
MMTTSRSPRRRVQRQCWRRIRPASSRKRPGAARGQWSGRHPPWSWRLPPRRPSRELPPLRSGAAAGGAGVEAPAAAGRPPRTPGRRRSSPRRRRTSRAQASSRGCCQSPPTGLLRPRLWTRPPSRTTRHCPARRTSSPTCTHRVEAIASPSTHWTSALPRAPLVRTTPPQRWTPPTPQRRPLPPRAQRCPPAEVGVVDGAAGGAAAGSLRPRMAKLEVRRRRRLRHQAAMRLRPLWPARARQRGMPSLCRSGGAIRRRRHSRMPRVSREPAPYRPEHQVCRHCRLSPGDHEPSCLMTSVEH